MSTVDGGNTMKYVYNALGQQVDSVVSGPVYRESYYDAFGRLAVTQNHTVTLEDLFPPVGGVNFVKFGGDPTGETLYLHGALLGTTAIITNEKNAAAQDQVYYPLGQQWIPANGGYDVRFGGMQERDAVTGLDPTPARQYNNNLGRWMSPDPLAGDITNPQSLNRYAYALNNPTTLIDPLGLDGCVPGAECVTVNGGTPPDVGFFVSQGLATLCSYSGYGCGYNDGANYEYTGGDGGNSTPPASKPKPNIITWPQLKQLVHKNNESNFCDELIDCIVFKESSQNGGFNANAVPLNKQGQPIPGATARG